MSESNHNDYRLEIWNGKEYIRTYAYSDGSRDQHNECIRALHDGKGDTLLADPKLLTFRIVRRDKKRTMRPTRKDMNWGSFTGRRNLGDGVSMAQQAQAAADFYIGLRTRDLNASLDPEYKTDVPVYPVKKSGRGIASEFRLTLATRLTGSTRTNAYWNKSLDQTRILVEKKLADFGYTFTEVNAGDYA